MIDPDIFSRANALSEEEERLYEHAGDGHGLTTEETDRLEAIRVELDRCYDLLHQRRARRAAGLDALRRRDGPADRIARAPRGARTRS